MIELYCLFIKKPVLLPPEDIYTSLQITCISNTIVSINPWYIAKNFTLREISDQEQKIDSVLPAFSDENLPEGYGLFSTLDCDNAKAFTFKAFKSLFRIIAKYEHKSEDYCFVPYDYKNLESGWTAVEM